MSDQIFDHLEAHPIIAAVRDEQGFTLALSSSVRVIFLLDATLCNLKERVWKVKEQQKEVFVHLEMVSGLSKDQAAVEFLKTEIDPSGIITTKANLIPSARQIGLSVVQRLFMLDSLSIQTGLKMVHTNRPDFVEVMPGIIPKIITEIKNSCQIPIIAGGMIRAKEEIIDLLKAGALAVSTSKKELWDL